ncbi:MAG: cation transporter, partial [Bacteroidales bacterium]|nr:cation transporter [Bacteroidales bacterium]
IAAALMLKGLTPGAALVFLMAGPAVNFASLLVVNKALGKKVTGIFLIGIIVCALVFGLSIDYLMPREWFSAISSETCHHEAIGLWQWICLAAFILLLINAFALKKRHRGEQSCHCGCHEEGCDCHEEKCACHEESCGCHEESCGCHDDGCGCHDDGCECKGDCNRHHNENDDKEDSANNEESAFFEIEGMRCNHCRSNLEEALSKIDGVKSVSVSLEEKSAIVLGHFNKQDLIDCIREMGFNLKDSLSE